MKKLLLTIATISALAAIASAPAEARGLRAHHGVGIGVGGRGAAVAAGTGRERNQQINLGEKFDEIAGPNGACFHEVLMRVARITSAHEYVHHVMNMNLSFFER